MKKHGLLLFLATIVLALGLISACGKENGNGGEPTPTATVSPTNTNTPTPTDTATPTPTNSATPTPTPVIYLENLNITGVDLTHDEKDAVMHLISIGFEAEYEGKSVNDVQMTTNGQGQIVFLYNLSEGYNPDGEYNSPHYLLFTTLEDKNFKVEQVVSLGEAQYCFLRERKDSFIVYKCSRSEDDGSSQQVSFFDYHGNDITDSALKECELTDEFILSGDSKYYYELDKADYTIWKKGLTTEEKTEIKYDENIVIKSIYGVSTIKGTDYICGTFMGVDLKNYEGVINAETGETLYLADDDTISYIFSSDDSFTINGKYLEETGRTNTLFNGDVLINYRQDSDFGYSYLLLGDKLAVVYTSYETHDEVFTTEDGDSFEYTVTDRTIADIALMDIRTSQILTTATIAVNGERDLSNVFYVDENRLAATFADQAGFLKVYLWNTDDKQYSDFDFSDIAGVVIQDFTGFDIPVINGQYTRRDFIPEECPDYLKEEREFADSLEKKYDIKIYISDETKCLMSGYVFETIKDKELLRECLETMDKEFAKYPEGFFSLYKKQASYPDGLELYFTGGIVGFEDGNLNRAGGLRTEDDDSINIALDCFDGRYEAAVHHELSHSIEVLIRELSSESLDEDYWDSINIKYGGNRNYYAYSYMHQDSEWLYGYKNNYTYTYQAWDWYPNNYKRVLFIDDYAMTYPTEDRSRIFEKVMWDNFDVSDFPALYEKMVYYSKLIKKMLVENGFDATAECYWEWVIKDNEEIKEN